MHYAANDRILRQRDQYMRAGSITHTGEALRALAQTPLADIDIGASGIRAWVNSHDRFGFVKPELEAWPESPRVVDYENIQFAKDLRHTATSLTCMTRLLSVFPKGQGQSEVRKWIVDRALFLAESAKVWHAEPDMEHSHVYMIEMYDEIRRAGLLKQERALLSERIIAGLEVLLAQVTTAEPFWSRVSHPDTKVFYTLLILVRILRVPEALKRPSWARTIGASLSALMALAEGSGGVSFAGEVGHGAASERDSGLAAQLLYAMYLSGRAREGLASRRLVDSIFEATYERSFGECSDKTITHSWSAMVTLSSLLSRRQRRAFNSFVRDVEPALVEVRRSLESGQQISTSPLARISALTGAGHVGKVITETFPSRYEVVLGPPA